MVLHISDIFRFLYICPILRFVIVQKAGSSAGFSAFLVFSRRDAEIFFELTDEVRIVAVSASVRYHRHRNIRISQEPGCYSHALFCNIFRHVLPKLFLEKSGQMAWAQTDKASQLFYGELVRDMRFDVFCCGFDRIFLFRFAVVSFQICEIRFSVILQLRSASLRQYFLFRFRENLR